MLPCVPVQACPAPPGPCIHEACGMPRQFGEASLQALDEPFRAFAFATCKRAVVCRQPNRSHSTPKTPKLSCFSVLPSAAFLNCLAFPSPSACLNPRKLFPGVDTAEWRDAGAGSRRAVALHRASPRQRRLTVRVVAALRRRCFGPDGCGGAAAGEGDGGSPRRRPAARLHSR